ncbi:MAG: hypothetical protein KGM42_08370 [Hyphomicrobiales bacterium]|nr:hypothetical protein [Hyphomicrobiales bacterium]
MRLDDNQIHMKSDVLAWSEPIIGDRIVEAYFACLGDNEAQVRPVARQHIRLWRAILSGEKRVASEARGDLLRLAAIARLGVEAVDSIDRLVLDELIDVLSSWLQRSPSAARAYSRIMIEAATTLTEARYAAA